MVGVPLAFAANVPAMNETADIPRELGPRLKHYRERAALTREETGALLGRSVYAVHRNLRLMWALASARWLSCPL